MTAVINIVNRRRTKPGPLTDKDEILREIHASKDVVLQKIKYAKEDICLIKQEVAGIKCEQK